PIRSSEPRHAREIAPAASGITHRSFRIAADAPRSHRWASGSLLKLRDRTRCPRDRARSFEIRADTGFSGNRSAPPNPGRALPWGNSARNRSWRASERSRSPDSDLEGPPDPIQPRATVRATVAPMTTISIAVAGAAGRMGRALLEQVLASPDLR